MYIPMPLSCNLSRRCLENYYCILKFAIKTDFALSASLNKELKGTMSRYFELFLPSTKLPLNRRKPENNTLEK